MAQIKTLKFNDNVLQVQDSYISAGETVSDPNIEFGTIRISDHCGIINLHSNLTTDVLLKLLDSCGSEVVDIEDTDGSKISFYEYGEKLISIGEKCGNFNVDDACGNSLLSYGRASNSDSIPTLALYGQGSSIQIGCYAPYGSSMIYFYDNCGDRAFTINKGYGIVLGNGGSVSDNCGGISLYDSSGCNRLYLSSPGFITLNHYGIDDSCGDFRIQDSCGYTIFSIPSNKYVTVDGDGSLKLVNK